MDKRAGESVGFDGDAQGNALAEATGRRMDLLERRLKLEYFGYQDFKRKVPPVPISDTGDRKSIDQNEPSCSLRDAVSRMEVREDNLSIVSGTAALKSQKVIDNRRRIDMLERLSFQDRIDSRTGRDGPIKDHFIPSITNGV
jgi:hypothetical protein